MTAASEWPSVGDRFVYTGEVPGLPGLPCVRAGAELVVVDMTEFMVGRTIELRDEDGTNVFTRYHFANPKEFGAMLRPLRRGEAGESGVRLVFTAAGVSGTMTVEAFTPPETIDDVKARMWREAAVAREAEEARARDWPAAGDVVYPIGLDRRLVVGVPFEGSGWQKRVAKRYGMRFFVLEHESGERMDAFMSPADFWKEYRRG